VLGNDTGCEDGLLLGNALGNALRNTEGLDVGEGEGGPFTHTSLDDTPEAVSPYDVACHSATTPPDAGGLEGANNTKS
jgi:hypothetical protein